MIKFLHIKNFKGLDDIELHNLKKVNIIAGKNGRGKTSILDAIFITNDIVS
ncbi:AAA family ATPase, partial [Cronobacter sakazakii]